MPLFKSYKKSNWVSRIRTDILRSRYASRLHHHSVLSRVYSPRILIKTKSRELNPLTCPADEEPNFLCVDCLLHQDQTTFSLKLFPLLVLHLLCHSLFIPFNFVSYTLLDFSILSSLKR